MPRRTFNRFISCAVVSIILLYNPLAFAEQVNKFPETTIINSGHDLGERQRIKGKKFRILGDTINLLSAMFLSSESFSTKVGDSSKYIDAVEARLLDNKLSPIRYDKEDGILSTRHLVDSHLDSIIHLEANTDYLEVVEYKGGRDFKLTLIGIYKVDSFVDQQFEYK